MDSPFLFFITSIMNNSIVTLWPDGSYSSQATKNIFPWIEIHFPEDSSNIDVIKAIPYYKASVSPIYNKYGTVVLQQLEEIYKLYKKHPHTLKVLGTHKLKIEHVLAGTNPDIAAKELTHIFSHHQALLQCEKNLNLLKNTKQIEAKSTVSEIKNINNKQAVICSEKAAQDRGLHIINSSIAPNDNYTEFAVITTNNNLRAEDYEGLNWEMKIAILTTSDKVLAISQATWVIWESWVNLKSIHSHPNWKWWVDFPLLLESIKGIDTESLKNTLLNQGSHIHIL